MKTLNIALKDLTRSFRSVFLLFFMFAIPLLMAGMFYLMFGNTSAQNSSAMNLPKTKVAIANLDQGSNALAQGLASQGLDGQSLGFYLVEALQNKSFSDLIEVSLESDAASAKSAVDNRQAGVAIIIPADFSAMFAEPGGKAVIELYQDPALSLGPGIVKSLLNQILDSFSGVKIALDLTLAQPQADAGSADSEAVSSVLQQYTAAAQAKLSPAALVEDHAPAGAKESTNLLSTIIGPIMGGMMIFFAFFTGGATAQTILKEDEEGTLPRLFTTPTRQSAILGGKFLAVGITVLAQVTVLLIASHLLFHIDWGDLTSLVPAAVGIIASAAAFGIFITSLLKSTRQSGAIFGGLMTITGMLGMMTIFTSGNPGAGNLVNSASLVVPQGWAVRGLLLSMNSGSLNEALVNLVVMVGISLALFAIGVRRFQQRYV